MRRCLQTTAARKSGKVVITGGAGNIGTKLAAHLVGVGHDVHVLDPWEPAVKVAGATYHKVNMLEMSQDWIDVITDAHAVAHLAAVNPYPEAPWSDVSASMLTTFNVMSASAENGVRRFINASSNHVMGGYKDTGGPYATDADGNAVAPITAASPPEVGTKWDAGGIWMDSTGYATAKVASEAYADHLAMTSTRTQFLTVRIGWCQPGDNRTNTMSASGTPTLEAGDEGEGDDDAAAARKGDPQWDQDLILDWYRLMWLSNRDICQLYEKAVDAKLPPDAKRHEVVNGMSNNAGMRWSLDEARHLLGYEPVDDAMEDVKYWQAQR